MSEPLDDPPEKTDRDLVNALIDERATHLNLTAEICRLLYIDRTSTSNLEDDLEQIRDAAIEINHERYNRNIEKD